MKKLTFENDNKDVLVKKISETNEKCCDICKEVNKKLFEFKTLEERCYVTSNYLTPIGWKIVSANRHICFDCVKQLFKEIK